MMLKNPFDEFYDLFLKTINTIVIGYDFRFGYKRAGDVELLKDFGNIYGFKVIAFDKLCIYNTNEFSLFIKQTTA